MCWNSHRKSAHQWACMQAPPVGADPQGNLIAAMLHWVEQGRVPDSVTGRISLNPFAPPSGSDKQRLHCAWPARAVLIPEEDPDRAASYRCRVLAGKN